MFSSYLLVALGAVVGAAVVLGAQLVARARAERNREAYFRDVVHLARRGGRAS